MEWTDISITVAKRDADTAEAIATMVANGGIYIEDYSDLEQQAWEIAHVDLIEQELLDKPRDVVIVHMYLAPDENPAEVLPLFEERLQNSGINYQLNTTGVEQEDCRTAGKILPRDGYWRPSCHRARVGGSPDRPHQDHHGPGHGLRHRHARDDFALPGNAGQPGQRR